jgi:16S rRNA (cytidine1402-2'-O)-methyltransferase
VRLGQLAAHHGELAAWAQTGPLGEITIVVAGAPPRRADPAEIGPQAAADVAARQRAGTPRKAAMAEVARELGLRTRDVYDAVRRYGADLPDESQR